MGANFDFNAVSESERIAFYGALFAMGAIDGSIDKEEMTSIFEVLDLETFSEDGRREVQSYLLATPDASRALAVLSSSRSDLRYALMVQLVEVALANDEIDPSERALLDDACKQMMITPTQLTKIEEFVRIARDIRRNGRDDSKSAEALKGAMSGLSAVAVPVAAVYLSGSVIGLSAAGITSGLAALGLGLGMVPGIGVAVLLGTATFMVVRYLFGRKQANQKQVEAEEKERRAQAALRNMQEIINTLIERIGALSERAEAAAANTAEIAALKERLRMLKQLLERRRAAAASASAS